MTPVTRTLPASSSRRTRRAITASLLVAIAFAGCEEIEDPSFQAWCGDTLCSWDVEAGTIARVGTWHPADYGVELTSTPTVLSQVTGQPTSAWQDATELNVEEADVEEVCGVLGGRYAADTNECLWNMSQGRPGCVRFEVVADVDPEAQVLIEVDYGADGTVDHTQPMSASSWEPVSFLTSVPSWSSLLRFRMHKRGTGRAVVAHFGVVTDSECADPVTVEERPLGVFCDDAAQCASGVCADVVSWRACSACSADADCGASETCQEVLDDAHPNGMYRACRNAP